MKFGEKLQIQRKNRKLTQTELAKQIGVTLRTIQNYENGTSYPQDRAVYFKLSDFFKVDINYFLTENEEFLTEAAEKFGRKGQAQAEVILEQAAALFAGGELSENDQMAFMNDMQALFLESKELARKKYTPKKYRKQPTDQPTEKGQQPSKG